MAKARQEPATEPEQRPAKNHPEKKIGPFPGGIGVAIWVNTIETQTGPQQIRSVTISPRRYRDDSGAWRDAPSFRPADLPALIFGLQKALEFVYTNPLSSQDRNGETGDDNIPF